MSSTKADIIARLQRELLPLQGFKPITGSTSVDVGLGRIKDAFPSGSFPLGAVHEFCCSSSEESASTGGFIAGIIGSLMRNGGVSLWISCSRTIFPPALKYFGIDPDKIIFIDLQKQRDVLWAMEEALKCDGLASVVAEINELSFTASRRLQLAVEQSRVTGFILYNNFRKLNTTACLTRWKVTPLSSMFVDGMPGVGFPRWNIELMKVRNGRPGVWQIEWREQRFRHITRLTVIHSQQEKKTG
jgi:protein ImuA